MKRKIRTKSGVVRFEDTPELRAKVFERVLAFYVEHESFHGESVMQCDAPQIDAAPMLSELVDEFGFDVEWSD